MRSIVILALAVFALVATTALLRPSEARCAGRQCVSLCKSNWDCASGCDCFMVPGSNYGHCRAR